MYKATLKTSKGESLSFDFPQKPEEVLLSQCIDFTKAIEQFEDWQKEQEEKKVDVTGVEYMCGYLKRALNAIKAFTGSSKVSEFKTGKFYDHLVNLLNDDVDLLDKESWEDTVTTLYANTFRVIGLYKPVLPTKGNCEFKVGNKIFVIPTTYRDALTGKIIFESIPTGQAIEALEVMRVYNNNIDNDSNGSIRFTSILKLVAILSRRKNKGVIEQFPTTEDGVRKLIDERIRYFSPRLNMVDALRIENFFLHGINPYRKTKDAPTSLTPQNV